MIFDITKLIYRRKNILSKDQAQFVIEQHEKLKRFECLESSAHAESGDPTVSTFKRVDIKYGNEAFDIVFKANEKIINEYMDYLDGFKMFHSFLRRTMVYSQMFRLLKYEVGTRIHPHSDYGPFITGSCSLNLNDEYTGGALSFFNGKHKINLKAGEGVIFPADYFWVHEIEKITSGVRYSLNSFLMTIPIELASEACNDILKKFEEPLMKDYNRIYRYNIRGVADYPQW